MFSPFYFMPLHSSLESIHLVFIFLSVLSDFELMMMNDVDVRILCFFLNLYSKTSCTVQMFTKLTIGNSLFVTLLKMIARAAAKISSKSRRGTETPAAEEGSTLKQRRRRRKRQHPPPPPPPQPSGWMPLNSCLPSTHGVRFRYISLAVLQSVVHISDITFGTDPDQDPAIFVIDLQDANKKIFFSKFFLLVTF
jgi:hypothetical protein